MTDLKTRLRDRTPLIGCIVSIPHPDVAEILALAGFDYLWIDLEHGPGDFTHAQALIQAVGGRCPCVIRVPENREVWIKKALDTGADGVVIPQVNSADEARRAVAACLYPPEGVRGAAAARAHGYGMAFGDYVARANREIAVIVQIEHADAVRDVGAILAVPGIDALLVGPFDLSGSMGLLGQVTHPEVQAAIATVRARALAAGMPLGLFVLDGAAARAAIAQGFTLIALNTDSYWLWSSAQRALKDARSS